MLAVSLANPGTQRGIPPTPVISENGKGHQVGGLWIVPLVSTRVDGN